MFRRLSKKFSAGLSKLHSTCPEKHLGDKVFLKKVIKLYFFGFSAKTIRRDCQNCILRVQRNILWFF